MNEEFKNNENNEDVNIAENSEAINEDTEIKENETEENEFENNEEVTKVEKFNLGKELFDWVQAIVIAVVIVMFIRTFIFTLVNVVGPSMEPTLHDKDRMVVVRLNYIPKKGDIIIFTPAMHQKDHYVKRVIATPGQTIDINFSSGDVIIDGAVQKEDYIKDLTKTMGNMKFPVTVPEDKVFVMGDNRNNSKDSRFNDVGLVSFDAIIGKAVFRFWPLSDFGDLYH